VKNVLALERELKYIHSGYVRLYGMILNGTYHCVNLEALVGDAIAF